jgi:hypothetical protein
MFYKNKDKYVGEWKDNKRNGKGVFYFQDGAVYQAFWENDKVSIFQNENL